MVRSTAALLFCLSVLFAVTHAWADEKADLASRLVALDGADAVVEQVVARQMPLVRKAFQRNYPDAQSGAESVYVEAFAQEMRARRGELIATIAAFYAESFDADELRQLLTFFESPIGRKYRTAAPAILEAARQRGKAWGEANAVELARKAAAAVAATGLELK